MYELEKSNLISFFNEEMKISHEKIKQKFSPIIESDTELRIFLQTLVHLGILEGYYSDLGFFYPLSHIKRNFRFLLIEQFTGCQSKRRIFELVVSVQGGL